MTNEWHFQRRAILDTRDVSTDRLSIFLRKATEPATQGFRSIRCSKEDSSSDFFDHGYTYHARYTLVKPLNQTGRLSS